MDMGLLSIKMEGCIKESGDIIKCRETGAYFINPASWHTRDNGKTINSQEEALYIMKLPNYSVNLSISLISISSKRCGRSMKVYFLINVGQFIEDLKSGHGILFLSNSEYFEGHFQDDYIDGEGTFTCLDGRQITNTWVQNKLIN